MWDLRKLVLEHIATMKDFVIEQNYCMLSRLELVGLGSFEKLVPSHDAHHMFPLLQSLIIRDCPRLLGLPFSNHIVYPPDQDMNIDWFPKLQELQVEKCPEFLLLAHIPWTKTLQSVNISDIKLLEKFKYSKSSYVVKLEIFGKDDMQSLDQVLSFHNLAGLEELTLKKCPPLESKHIMMLTSLKKLVANCLDDVVVPVGGEEWQKAVECLVVQELCGKELTKLLTHLPRLSKLEIKKCENITQLVVGVDVQHTSAPFEVEQEKENGLLLFPAHLSDSLRELVIEHCPELVLVDPARGGGGFQALQSLQTICIFNSPKVLSASSFSCCLFPSSLQDLFLRGVEGIGTLEPLSNLTSLTELILCYCGEDLRCKGLGPLLTTGQLRELHVCGSPRFFAGWDPNPRRVLEDEEGDEQELQQLVSPPSSSKLQILWTDDPVGLLAVPICNFLSSSLTHLHLSETYEIERFTKEQEDALHLLVSLQQLEFLLFNKLQSLPAGLHKLTNLKRLQVWSCLAIRSLPKDGLPKSLQELDVSDCGNEELIDQCRGLAGTIPKIKLQPRD